MTEKKKIFIVKEESKKKKRKIVAENMKQKAKPRKFIKKRHCASVTDKIFIVCRFIMFKERRLCMDVVVVWCGCGYYKSCWHNKRKEKRQEYCVCITMWRENRYEKSFR